MHIDNTVYSEGKLGMILAPKDLVTNVAMTKEKLEKKKYCAQNHSCLTKLLRMY